MKRPTFTDGQREADRRQLGPRRRDWFLVGVDRGLVGLTASLNPRPTVRQTGWMSEGYEWARLARQAWNNAQADDCKAGTGEVRRDGGGM